MTARSINTPVAAALVAGATLFAAVNAAEARSAGKSENRGSSVQRTGNINSTAPSTSQPNRNRGRYQLRLEEARKLLKE